MNFDVAIIGSGLAGLSVALNLADTRRVAILAKRSVSEGASDWAQGGIAAVLDSADSIDNHVRDTLIAGGGLCDETATRFIVENGRAAIEWLIGEGVPFTKDLSAELGFHLTREGGHSHRRIIHAADATGHAVVTTLNERVRNHPNITVLEDHYAIDLITSERLGLPGHRCHGLYALDLASGRTVTIEAPHTVLATGGAGKVYLYTTNPDTATGDGIAMAWRAGCRVSNMEFDGTRFMPAHDERAELAPRDIVARAIDFEIKKRGIDCVYLDISHQPEAFLQEHFPTILARCREFGIDITKQPIPVVPAAHYTCGGVVTDLAGRTDRTGLYAVGETSCTGLHGANRLASNSLLECLVVGRAAAQAMEADGFAASGHAPLPAWDESRVSDPDEEVVVAHNWDELRRLMWNYVGIVRTDKRLARAQHRIAMLRDEIHEYYANFKVSRDLLELRNLVDVASLIVQSACSRRESRGLHFSRDWPETLPKALPTVLTPSAVRRREI
jgi:L-aspartate oxidase